LDLELADDEGFERGEGVLGRVEFADGVAAADGVSGERIVEGDAIGFGIHELITKLNMITNRAIAHNFDSLTLIITPVFIK
jgi:hypothetical protein